VTRGPSPRPSFSMFLPSQNWLPPQLPTARLAALCAIRCQRDRQALHAWSAGAEQDTKSMPAAAISRGESHYPGDCEAVASLPGEVAGCAALRNSCAAFPVRDGS